VRNHDAEGQPVKIGLLQRYAIDHMSFEEHPFARCTRARKSPWWAPARRPVVRAPRLAMLGNEW
jgi:glutamate synthase (NADPH/NADH) small chain